MEKSKDLTSCNSSEGWNEADHPRDEEGLFVEKGGGLTELLGPEYKGYKGQAAVDKLLKERKGHVKAAFHRDDIGDIDLLWGSGTLGLQHIIMQRQKQGIDINEFLSDISNVVENGKFRRKTDRGDFEFIHNGKIAVIAIEYHGQELQYLLTAYKTRIKDTAK